MLENNITFTGSDCHPPATTVKEALDRARECANCAQKTAVIALLESEIGTVWKKILADPNYLMSRDEFAIFNFFQTRFEGQQVARDARKRYWDHKQSIG
ncbi:hypothetical protein GcM1_222022 [Golovinomyces cichoracearum]|uniref:Uncharacterized protein n=1 Tax=Golovinomyces cichoracearum TaxID=62708 RepID=A0A420IRB5_9PEZI|nr:hypothetical protein GcM1_222022 [Golovinomyces cichoracearum]